MAPSKLKTGDITVNDALESISRGSLKDRGSGLDDLIFLLDKKGKSASLSALGDKHYHHIFESLFRCAVTEKQSFLGGKRTTAAAAGSRLTKCAEALRLSVNHGASKLKRKTILALIDHITQTLPGPDEEFVEPLLKDYVKSLVALLAHLPNGEHLATMGADGWLACVDFCTEAMARYLENADRDSSSRVSPAPGTASVAFSTARSTNPSQRASGQIHRGTVQDLLHCLYLLVLPPNAPIGQRSRDLSRTLIQVLQLRHLGLSQVTQLAFASLNILLSSIQADDLSQASDLARDLVPLISHWWQARTVSQDEMLNSIRDEMLKTIFIIHLHLEHLVCNRENNSVKMDIEDLAESLWLEYSRRDIRSQLQLDDLTIVPHRLPQDYFTLQLFGLRAHNREGERRWALVQNIALLERIIWKRGKKQRSQSPEKQPRKKRKTEGWTSRLQDKIQSPISTVRRTCLQLVPFLLDLNTFTSNEISELLPDLTTFLSDKDATASSWAMLACASCAIQHVESNDRTDFWRHIWQIAARAVSLPSTSRAACVLLHTILETNLVPYHDISGEVNSLVTTADVNGPALLVDSSIILMLHLLFLRNIKLPNASQATCHHIIRWIFLKWNPADLIFASLHSVHMPVLELVNLIRACCGAELLSRHPQEVVSGGPICQTWRAQYHAMTMTRYLLLLEEPKPRNLTDASCSRANLFSELIKASDSATFHASKKLALELIFPKVEEMQELCNSWAKRGSEGSTPISPDRLHSLFSATTAGIMLVPQLADLNSGQSRDIESNLAMLSETSLDTVLNSSDSHLFFEVLFRAIRPVLPSLGTSGIDSLSKNGLPLLKLLAALARASHERTSRQSSGQNHDLMDLDDEFDSQESKASVATKPADIPRLIMPMNLDPCSFTVDTAHRIYLFESIHKDNTQIGIVPAEFLDRLLQLPNDEFLRCNSLASEVFGSDLIIGPDDALRVVEKLGEIIGEAEYTCCEVAHSTSLGILESLIQIWTDDKNEVSSFVGDLYNYFVKASLPKNSLSPKSQMSLASLLFSLLRINPQYGSNLGLSSCRTTLLSVLQQGTLAVKYFIGAALPDIFGIYVLKMHDDIFIDVLNSLPTDPEAIEGIAFRLFVLSQLACRWPTLLRRCTYHIFETPGQILQSTKYAKRCLEKVSDALLLSSPQELFSIFKPQLLYTWLELDAIEDVPFEIFGFNSLDALLRDAQAETAALEIMRGRYESVRTLSQRLGTPLVDMVKQSFTKIIAYTIAHDTSTSGSDIDSGETWLRKTLGRESYLDLIYLNFADMVALLFDLFDQEDPIEKYLARDKSFQYANKNMEEMKKFSQSTTALPPNQQPMFRAKFLLKELFHLCSRTEYELHGLWTPALVVSVVRKLLNTVHPALGSLHACSVLRKVRVVIALAGPVALEAYPLEMLLVSIRPFIVDSECADDALGISRYLIAEGNSHLLQTPSFLAGYALSTLASLRVFLESSQSSTTQESQFKATMSKTRQFHSWFSTYLAGYESPNFANDSQRQAFRSIAQSASNIRSSGNAEKGTHESTLLLEILKDGDRDKKLLNEAARDLALGMLCGDFVIPPGRQDVIDNDNEALRFGGLVWKSCTALALSDEYLAWAGRVVGRSFAASGDIQPELLEESELSQYCKLVPGANDSEQGLLNLLQQLTQSKDSVIAGLAESALRAVVSEAASQGDDALLVAAQKTLTESLCLASVWGHYRTPPSDYVLSQNIPDSQVFFRDHIERPDWIQQLAVHLTQSVPEYIILDALVPILKNVKGFAQDSFPFIVHLALYSQIDKQHTIKRNLSEATKEWLKTTDGTARTNQRHLINTILYLRTQKLPKESSIADRAQWLDVDFTFAASAASLCGMYKTALLFAEVAASQISRSSRRSSAVREEDTTDTLLAIFENIDDPDAYYGLTQSPDFSSVLARLEYEKDGQKNLAFRGAQYDSHFRRGDPASHLDSQSLVRALGTLGLSGLSHSLLQTQQSHDGDEASLESTFQTARRLEVWNLPAPTSADNYSVTIYRAYQNIQQARDTVVVRTAIYDGFSQTMRNLINRNLNAAKLRQHLGALAVLTELDDLVNVADFSELECMLGKFGQRNQWMRRGRYEDVGQLLSCRETTLSLMSQRSRLRDHANLSTAEARQVQIRCMLMSSGIYRFHQATQESLNLSTSLTDLVPSCEELGLKIDAAVKIEAANSLWDHGEMISSIRMLQSIDDDSSLKKQTIHVSRSDLLSRIGHQVSIARLEKPHHIQKNYLEPALKELKGKSQGQQAGHVFHQFAMFCDEQLQNQDSLEDLARLQSLKKGKSDEVVQLQNLISSSRDSQLKSRYQSHLNRAKQWLQLDEQELRRVEQTRSEFVRLSLENYLLALIASDENNNDALRFTALWLERSDEDATNDAVRKHLDKVPTRKFATLMSQLSSRLQDQSSSFQKLLINLVYNICVDHPYHGMYQIWSGTKVKTRKEDQVAVLRLRATEKIASLLQSNKTVAAIWQAVDRTSSYYHRLAIDRDSAKYKAGHKIALREAHSAQSLLNALLKYHVPPPTMQLEVSADKDYSKVPIITNLEPQMSIASGVSAPKIITAVGSDGERYKQLVKGGNDDLRQDAIMEQVFAAVSSLLKLHRSTQQRNLGIRTYKVLPLTSASGLIEFVPNTIPLHEYLMPAHEKYFPKDLKGSQCRKEISNAQGKSTETRINVYRKVTERFHPVMKYFFMEHFVDPDEWFAKRLAYTRTTAAISMLGHVLGLGDRHGHNILLDNKTGEVVHIDLGVAFEMGRVLPVPELVPFRLTRDIVDGMGITGTEGVFRRCCEFTLHALREETYSIMTILDVLRYDPLYSWSISPVRLAKLQGGQDDGAGDEDDRDDAENRKGRTGGGQVNEPSEADRALEVVRKKLSKTLSVTATVNDLINQATDVSNLAVLYSGWAAYA